ncbi:pentapeptide repeat-containing protein [Rhodovulum sulfidophilum]|uniref:pentapeptide repeat-containing protein n=1 Tax=Rhodovulum sulfidophilum TaxID=35806 RepID=UPI001921CE17|nr:pentapeptide repeat-containing protein [Rhodovulum sulfidophilum]MBL3597996.1 pentapeptide repeat-containing protein [Rhodovulum sulfidophilum]
MRKRDAYRARKSVLKNKTRPVRSEAGTSVGRIDALTRNARNTWFALLGLLVFVGITLMSVEHIDFYGIDRATRLPLVNVDVPTRYFFVTAPILTAAFYIYFHLHLIRLWDALGAADSRIGGQPLGDAVMPWLVTDAALHLRNRWRADNCAAPHALDVPATFLNLLLTWGFGLIVLGWLWWLSMSARTFGMTAIACSALLAATGVGLSSLKCLFEKMGPDKRIWQSWRSAPIILIGVVITAFSASFLRTGGVVELWAPLFRLLAPIDMTGLAIVEKPPGWLPRDIAKTDFFADWCKREGTDCTRKELSEEQRALFEEEFRRRREIAIGDLRKPLWHQLSHQKPDFRGAWLIDTFLVGAGLSGARMEGAILDWARMEGADLSNARMDGALLMGAQMEDAELYRVHMEGANLAYANLDGAVLTGAHMEGAGLSGARIKGALLNGAHMEGASLAHANLEGAYLTVAHMDGADLRWAQLEGGGLGGAQMEGANLSGSLLTDVQFEPVETQSTNLRAATNNGGALRFIDLRNAIFNDMTDFRNAFLDGSVQITDGFRKQMGDPCQWHADVLSDEEFFGRWRGWIEASVDASFYWPGLSPEGWSDVAAIPPPDGCTWKTGSISDKSQ